MSCGGSHDSNANAAAIAETVKTVNAMKHGRVTVKDGTVTFHNLIAGWKQVRGIPHRGGTEQQNQEAQAYARTYLERELMHLAILREGKHVDEWDSPDGSRYRDITYMDGAHVSTRSISDQPDLEETLTRADGTRLHVSADGDTYAVNEDGDVIDDPADPATSVLRKEAVGDVRVSTVLLPRVYGTDQKGRALRYETMVFGHDLGTMTDEERAETWSEPSHMVQSASMEEALDAHRDAVFQLRNEFGL